MMKTFPVGGIHPHDHKLSAQSPIEKLALPLVVSIPIAQHIGASAVAVVKPNDKVKVGQLIAQKQGFISANIHSSVSGTVLKIDDVMDLSGYKRKAIVIKVEGDDWLPDIDLSQALKRTITLDSQKIIEKISDTGLVGLGGAAFPSHVKLTIPQGQRAEYLLVNGVECEPYLTSDHRLMLEKGEEILVGVQILMKALNVPKAFIGIESNKSDAIAHFKMLVKDFQGIEICPLKMKYPQGGERQLVKAILNREIPPPPAGLPIDVGCVVFNVGTCFAVYEAIQKNKPLVDRIVTVTGKSISKPSNFQVRIGTSISDLILAAGGCPDDAGKIIAGGPMMGKALNTAEIPVTKAISGILVVQTSEAARKEVLPCIRCAKCVFNCPLGMEPYLLMPLVQKGMYERAEEEKIVHCCDCGCCSYVCPSNRPLADYIKLGKSVVLKNMKSRNA